MSRFLELTAELAILDLKIEVALASEKARAIREIQARMYEWGIEPKDLREVRRGPKYVPKKSGLYVPKYRDPDSGATWSGKGREPRWIAGKARAVFSIVSADIDPLASCNG
jgi:DNA-binding protein H-NS